MASDTPPPVPGPEDAGDVKPLRPEDEPRSGSSLGNVTTFVYDGPPAPTFRFEHDQEKKLFVLTWPDGRIERFRDNPARQLHVEPDRKTGELRPVVHDGEPVYVYLCREEREL